MSNLEKSLFQLKFTAKTLNRQSKKAQKDENTEKAKLKKCRRPKTKSTLSCPKWRMKPTSR
ncbi:hypothetical protein RSAG8_00864, partial [Rhizoctonia solani AG-8 WAC10335]